MRVPAAFPLAFLAFASTGAPAAPAPLPQPRAPSAVSTVRVERSDLRLAATKGCDPFVRVERARDGAMLQHPAPRAERLDRLPAGDLHLTVERQMDGCRQPVVIRENIGGPGFRR
jgi:hypothetical protein